MVLLKIFGAALGSALFSFSLFPCFFLSPRILLGKIRLFIRQHSFGGCCLDPMLLNRVTGNLEYTTSPANGKINQESFEYLLKGSKYLGRIDKFDGVVKTSSC